MFELSLVNENASPEVASSHRASCAFFNLVGWRNICIASVGCKLSETSRTAKWPESLRSLSVCPEEGIINIPFTTSHRVPNVLTYRPQPKPSTHVQAHSTDVAIHPPAAHHRHRFQLRAHTRRAAVSKHVATMLWLSNAIKGPTIDDSPVDDKYSNVNGTPTYG